MELDQFGDDPRDPVADARAVVDEWFPRARWAVLSGSVVDAHRTAGSDLDIVVLVPDGEPGAPRRQSVRRRGWPVELFVHDDETLAHYLARELAARRPVLHRMISTGRPIIGDAEALERAQRECKTVLTAGPAPLTDDERERIRYGLTDLLDDLAHAVDSGERAVITAWGWTALAADVLALGRHWTGTGKWLLRELRDHDPAFAERWLDAHGDPAAVSALIREVLDSAGGPLFDGFSRAGERPPATS